MYEILLNIQILLINNLPSVLLFLHHRILPIGYPYMHMGPFYFVGLVQQSIARRQVYDKSI